MPLIKSHSNYVLKKKHQLVTDGTIYERDITTIGAVNQFAPGQIPIYRSGNFIITVRDDRRGTNQYNTKKWEKGIDGETWTLTTVENMTSKDVLQDDTKIIITNITWKDAKKTETVVFEDTYNSLLNAVKAKNTEISDLFKKKNVELYGFSKDRKNIEFLVA